MFWKFSLMWWVTYHLLLLRFFVTSGSLLKWMCNCAVLFEFTPSEVFFEFFKIIRQFISSDMGSFQSLFFWNKLSVPFCLFFWNFYHVYFSPLDQFSSVAKFVSSSLRCHGLQRIMPPCPSRTPAVYSNSCLLRQWCYPTFSASVVPFSSCLQSFPASGSFQMSQLFAS